MIPIIRDLGYNFVTVDECLGMSAYQNVNSLENKGAAVNATATNTIVPANVTSSTPTSIVRSDDRSNLKSGAETLSYSLLSLIILAFITLFNFN